MLGGGDEHALAHEAGGVADLGDVAADGGNFEVVEVGAAEDDAGAGGRGQKPHGDGCAGMESYPCELEGLSDRLLQVCGWCQKTLSKCGKLDAIDRLDGKSAKLTCGIFATEWTSKATFFRGANGASRIT